MLAHQVPPNSRLQQLVQKHRLRYNISSPRRSNRRSNLKVQRVQNHNITHIWSVGYD